VALIDSLLSVLDVDTWEDAHRFSIERPAAAWSRLVQLLDLDELGYGPVIRRVDETRAEWWPEARLNLAASVLRRAGDILWVRESGSLVALSAAAIEHDVRVLAAELLRRGVKEGDRVLVHLPPSPAAVVGLLAPVWIGAVSVPTFSGYGTAALEKRTAGARVAVSAESYQHGGVTYGLAESLPDGLDVVRLPLKHRGGALPQARRVRSETPAFVCYTSGTTGEPKGAVHVHGGFLAKTVSETGLQLDLGPGDTLLWVTDPGWVMGVWQTVAGLARGASIVWVEGKADPFAAGAVARATHFGFSPTLVRAGARPFAWPELRRFASTGEPWDVESWRRVAALRLPICNLSGGTEVGTNFLSPNPHTERSLHPCSLGGPCFGMDVDIVDEDGRPTDDGELICRGHWPGMTRGLWGDEDGERFWSTYWRRYPGAWHHGDRAQRQGGQWFLPGRSDEVLNVSGKRVSPAEVEGYAGCDCIASEDEGGLLVRVVDADPAAVEARIRAALGRGFRVEVRRVETLPRTASGKAIR